MIWLILLLGLALRLISLNQSLWLDEAINTLAARNYSLIDLITQYARADFHPPGWFIILWFWTKLFGYSEIAVRIPSVIFGILTIWTVYLSAKKFKSRELGIIAALLLSINPLHIYYSQEARMYSLATLAVSINIFLLIKVVKKEKLNLFYLILSNFFVLASDYVAYFIFPAQFVFLLLYQKHLLKKWLIALFSALLIGVWWLPTFLGQLNVGVITSSNLPTWKFINGAFDFKTLPLTFVKFIIGRISLTDKLLYGAVLLPVCNFFAYLLWRGVKSSDNLSRKLLLSWLVIPSLIATIISFQVPVYNYFRVLYILPPFIILISLGILSFRRFYFILGSVVLVELFCSLVYLFNPLYQREDWKGLVSFFKNKPALILFESSGTLPPFDYYSKNQLNSKGALKDFPARNDNDVADFIGTNIYLVDYLVQISDPARLVAKKLTELRYKQTDIKNFTGIGFVYHYIKND